MDEAIGHAASAHPKRLAGAQDALIRLLDVARATGRLYATRGDDIIITIPGRSDPLVVSLPTMIRGRFVANLTEFCEVEIERPLSENELASDI